MNERVSMFEMLQRESVTQVKIIDRLTAENAILREALEKLQRFVDHREDNDEVCYDWCPQCTIKQALNQAGGKG
jgi:hypothetical protein